MSPVLPSERIAHLGTVDCWIYPPGRYETIAVTPPIIFSKGGSPKQATPLLARPYSGSSSRTICCHSRERPSGGRTAHPRDELAALHVWMAPAWQEKM